MNKNRHAIRI